MARVVFLLFLVVAVYTTYAEAVEVQGERCGRHEIWTDCGTACPRVCGKPPAEACIAMCVQGCFCRRGFIRSSKGNCIPESHCLDAVKY